ncbi:MAG: tyrosine recombinase XerC [Clostridium sp.]|nr:tyrosine recombinase XerC [Clostridium sp.]
MNEIRNKSQKYKNYEYTEEIKQLLNIELTQTDERKLNKIYKEYKNLNVHRGYEYIIKDLYILCVKEKLSTKKLSEIYGVGVRTIQIWLKELGLNRDSKAAAKASKKSKDLIISKTFETTKRENSTNPFGIIVPEENVYPDSLTDFFNYLDTIKGKSQNTIDGYAIDLTMFFRFMKVYKGFIRDTNLEFHEIPINDITNEFIRKIKLTDMYAFLSFVEKNRENGTYARARKVASLKAFFKFLQVRAKVIDENPTLDLESPKLVKRQPVYLTLDQSIALLNSLDKEDKNYERDYCILTLFLNCGMRLSELCSINIEKIKGDILTIVGKGDKERTIYLNDASIKAINTYLRVRDTSKVSEEDKKYLFLSARNKPINKRTVEILVKKHIGNAGIVDGKYTPHKLRHTAATLMYKYGNVDIRSLQSILGHENISTTQIYTHVDDESLREAVKSNPLSKL